MSDLGTRADRARIRAATTVPGLPPNWPELLAAALADACASDEEFEIIWRQLGKTVRFLARDLRNLRASAQDAPSGLTGSPQTAEQGPAGTEPPPGGSEAAEAGT